MPPLLSKKAQYCCLFVYIHMQRKGTTNFWDIDISISACLVWYDQSMFQYWCRWEHVLMSSNRFGWKKPVALLVWVLYQWITSQVRGPEARSDTTLSPAISDLFGQRRFRLSYEWQCRVACFCNADHWGLKCSASFHWLLDSYFNIFSYDELYWDSWLAVNYSHCSMVPCSIKAFSLYENDILMRLGSNTCLTRLQGPDSM